MPSSPEEKEKLFTAWNGLEMHRSGRPVASWREVTQSGGGVFGGFFGFGGGFHGGPGFLQCGVV